MIMAKHRVIIQLTKYENPGSKTLYNKNCDGWFGRECDYRFDVCIGTLNAYCLYHKKSYGGYHNAPEVYNFNPKITIELLLTDLKVWKLVVRSLYLRSSSLNLIHRTT